MIFFSTLSLSFGAITLLWHGRQRVQKRAGYVGFGSWDDLLVSSVKKRLVSSIEDVSRM